GLLLTVWAVIALAISRVKCWSTELHAICKMCQTPI
ncbi:ser/Thr phosphatase domain protein, partial [Vibrio parahaemolyticus V-223/04]